MSGKSPPAQSLIVHQAREGRPWGGGGWGWGGVLPPVGRGPRTRILGAGRRPPQQLGPRGWVRRGPGGRAAGEEGPRGWREGEWKEQEGRPGKGVGAGRNSVAPCRAGKHRPGPRAEGEGEGPCLPTSPPRPPSQPALSEPSQFPTLQREGVGGKNPGPLPWARRLGDPAPPSPSPLPFWPGLSIPPNCHAGKRAAPRPSLLFT